MCEGSEAAIRCEMARWNRRLRRFYRPARGTARKPPVLCAFPLKHLAVTLTHWPALERKTTPLLEVCKPSPERISLWIPASSPSVAEDVVVRGPLQRTSFHTPSQTVCHTHAKECVWGMQVMKPVLNQLVLHYCRPGSCRAARDLAPMQSLISLQPLGFGREITNNWAPPRMSSRSRNITLGCESWAALGCRRSLMPLSNWCMVEWSLIMFRMFTMARCSATTWQLIFPAG
jgi:hypothetical protein